MQYRTASPIELEKLADDEMKSLTGGLKAQWMDGEGGGDGGDGLGGGG